MRIFRRVLPAGFLGPVRRVNIRTRVAAQIAAIAKSRGASADKFLGGGEGASPPAPPALFGTAMTLPSTSPPPGGPDAAIRILVVDDEPAVRHLLKRWIHRAFSIDIAEAENGLQALDALGEGKFDLVITDLNMPVLDGIEMLSLIRADPSHAHLEVVVATVVGAEAKVRAAVSMGVSDYLLKPLRYELVITRLKAVIDLIRAKRPPEPQTADHSRTRVLIADRDPAFREFAGASLARHFEVASVGSTAQALVKVLHWSPDAIVLSQDLPGTPLDFLVNKARAIAKPRELAVYLLGDGGDEKVDVEVQGIVKRTFVAEAFRAALVSLLGGGSPPEDGVLAWIGALEPDVSAAIRQSLGMLAGCEPNALAEFTACAEPDYFAKIELNGSVDNTRIRLGMRASRSFAASIVLAMIGGEESDLNEEARRGGIQEVLNVVAGRIKNSCEDRQIDLAPGAPEFASADFGPLPDAAYEKRFPYQWQDTPPFEVVLSARSGNPSPATAAPIPADDLAPAADASEPAAVPAGQAESVEDSSEGVPATALADR